MANEKKREIRLLMKGRTDKQRKAIRYFYKEKAFFFKRLMTDKEYEQMVMNIVQSTDWKTKALKAVGVTEEDVQEVSPIYFEGYDHTQKTALSMYGRDRKWRSSHYQISWIFCSEKKVYIWQYTFSTINDEKKERVDEFYYKNIINVSTITESIEKEIAIKRTWKGKVVYGLKNIESKQFSFIVPGDRLNCQMNERSILQEDAISDLKTKLREFNNH